MTDSLPTPDLTGVPEPILTFFKGDQYARLSGIELVSVSPGKAVARMMAGAQHGNGYKTIHGGALFTLADFAFAVACNSHGTVAVSINASISYIKAAGPGLIQAEAREISRNSRIGAYTVDVTNAQGELLAVFQGLAYRKKEAIADICGNTGDRPAD